MGIKRKDLQGFDGVEITEFCVGIQKTTIGFSKLLKVKRKTGRWRERQNYIKQTVLR